VFEKWWFSAQAAFQGMDNDLMSAAILGDLATVQGLVRGG
jgi:hypothetical protein